MHERMLEKFVKFQVSKTFRKKVVNVQARINPTPQFQESFLGSVEVLTCRCKRCKVTFC
jgi:hypothetical protein